MTSSTARLQARSRNFDGLNYAFGNEDCSVEAALLPYDAQHIATVCHSGAQLIPFLNKRPKAITFIDISKEQLIIAQLRYELLRRLPFEDYIRFWGYDAQGDESHRRSCLKACEFPSRDAVEEWLDRNEWRAPLYIGKWEQTASKLARLYRAILGNEGLKIFECKSLSEKEGFLKDHFPHRRWKFLVNTAASIAALYACLRPSQMPPGTKALNFYHEYRRIFDALLHSGLAQDNFFFEMLMWGRFRTAKPLEATRSYYDEAKLYADRCVVHFEQKDVFDFLKDSRSSFDFVTLSNVTSYVSLQHEHDYLRNMKHTLSNEARVVVRHFLRTTNPILDGYVDETACVTEILEQECTHVYEMKVYKRNN